MHVYVRACHSRSHKHLFVKSCPNYNYTPSHYHIIIVSSSVKQVLYWKVVLKWYYTIL